MTPSPPTQPCHATHALAPTPVPLPPCSLSRVHQGGFARGCRGGQGERQAGESPDGQHRGVIFVSAPLLPASRSPNLVHSFPPTPSSSP
ncbi:hypothetical protein E2C01_049916 [Portunus trituberculatus]|uniref:Uncharacterized protein n=1 Tax=Portunus trituberculatus TaxID=210409 RepID=A0A5B7GEN1_PORTR|nr:hypothetical protein [Portunus trituberculatus]